MQRIPTSLGAIAGSLLTASLALFVTSAQAQHQLPKGNYAPTVAPASGEGAQALKSIRIPKGWKIELFAAEPLLANPVAFCIDERNRFYVAETFRLNAGVTDTRGHMNWLDDDLACRTVEDRVAKYKRHLGAQFESYGIEHDRVRLVEDRDGDGKADHATVYADGFNNIPDGLGAGLLARGGDVWYTCIPDLWKLRDNDGDGRADVRRSLHHGYGVHTGFIGHDLHGLRFGPDGKLYFSIGDRGFNVTTEGRNLALPDTGAVLRCEPDGSNLEIVASGLRNPQELAFDQFGNLFTGDNNSDGGDKARWVYVVEGGDSGWRMGYQYIESPASRGPWNAERLWHPQWDGQAAYIVPPLANLADGPSGLTYDPGTGLPEPYRNHFFLADFRGGSGQSGIRAFAVKPKGASFEVVDQSQFVWSVLATDVDFGTDGSLYFSDWVEGWNKPGKGRIYRVFHPGSAGEPNARQVRTLLAEGMKGRSNDELTRLLAHADVRVRQGAQFALADQGENAIAVFSATASKGSPLLARLHAIWGLGQIGRKAPKALEPVKELLDDGDAEVRSQATKVVGDGHVASAVPKLIGLLRDDSLRVRFFAAISLGKLGSRDALGPILAMLRENADRDPYLRHAGVMALVGLDNEASLLAAARDESAAVRMGVLLALRRKGSPEVARFLEDAEPRLVLEAARAINDAPINAAMPRLAALPIRSGASEPLLRRVLNANFRLGEAEHASALAGLAGRNDVPESIRAEALQALGQWARPSGRDRVMGLWRPIDPRSPDVAANALRPQVADLLRSAPDDVREAAALAAGRLGIRDAGPGLLALVSDGEAPRDARIVALKALDGLHDERLAEAVERAATDSDARVRTEGLRLLAKLQPAEAVRRLEQALADGSAAERQGALDILGGIDEATAAATLSRWMDRLLANDVPAEIQLDLLEAAARQSSPDVKAKLARYEAGRRMDDPLAAYREALAGGNARRGRGIFQQKAEVSCLRCHKVRGEGGEVGPDLTGIGGKQGREYLLESLVAPNKQIAQGFETRVVATSDGQVHTGVFKSDTGDELRLVTAEGQPLSIPKSEIEDEKRGASAMPDDLVKSLSKSELRDLVEFLSSLK